MYNPNPGVPHQQMQQPQHQLAGVAGHIISPMNPANIFVQTPALPQHRFPPITFMNGNVGENHEAFQVMSPPTAPNINPYNDTEYAIGGNQAVPSNEASTDAYSLTADNTEKIEQQLAYYLSAGNLVKDTYLTASMDKEGFMPIEVIASFRRITELTKDLDVKKRLALVTNILKGADFAEVDPKGEKVRPPIQQDIVPHLRTRLLVRSVPDGVDSVELTKLFEMQEGCPSSTSVERIGQGIWYVCFATEQDTLIVHNLISQATLKCRGQHLNACIKSIQMTRSAAAVAAAPDTVEAPPQPQRIEVAPPPQRFEGPPPRFEVLPQQRVEVPQPQRFEGPQTQRIDAAQPRFETAFHPQRVEIAQPRIYDSQQRFEAPQPSRYEPTQLHRFEVPPQPPHGRFETPPQPHSRFEAPPRMAEIIHRPEIPRLENFQRSEPRSAEVPVLSRQPFYPQPAAGLAPVRHTFNQQTRIIVPFHPTQQSFMSQNYQLPPTAVLGTYPSQLWAQPPQSQFLVTDMNGAVIQIQNCQPQIYPQLQQMIATDPTRIYGIQAAHTRPRATQFVQVQQSNFLPQQIYPPPRSRRDSNGHHEFKRPDRSSYPARHNRPNSGGSRVEYGHFAANQLSEQSGMSASAVDINKMTPSVAVSADQSFSDGQSVDDIRSEANSVIGNAEDQPDATMTSGGVEPQWQNTPATTVGVAAAHISSSGAAVYTTNDGHATSSSSWQRGPGGRDAPLPQRYQGANRGNKRSNRNYEDTNYRFNNRGKTQPVSEPQFDFERDSFSFPTLKETLQTAVLPGPTPTTAAHDSASEGSERLARPPSMLSSTQMTSTSAVAQPELPSVGNSQTTNPDNSVTSSAPQLDSTPSSNAVDNNGNKESMSNTSAKPSYAQIAQKGKHPSSDETILVNDERSGEPAVIRETSGYNGLDGGPANPVQNRFSPEQDSRRPVQDYNGYNRRGSGRGRGGRGVFYNSSRVYRD